VSVSSTASLVEDKAVAGLRPTGLPVWLRKALRLLLGLAATALIWEAAVLLFGIRPAYLPRLSTILMAIAATPGAYVNGFLRTSAETLIGFVTGSAFGVLTPASPSSACGRCVK